MHELLAVLRCPISHRPLRYADGSLEDSLSVHRYNLVDGIPDLRRAPERLNIDRPWYEPWQDLEDLPIGFPAPTADPDLPYHLDKYLATSVPPRGDGEWVLEVGCGERQAERWFAGRGFKYVGVDVEARGQGPNILADAHNLPVVSESIDYCASMAVLEHLVSPLTMASEVYRVLKPGGIFFGSAAFMYGFHDRASFHHMSHAGLMYILRCAGFTVELMWPDWKYPDAISAWPFRGAVGAPWRVTTRSVLRASEWSFTGLSNLARRIVGKPGLDRLARDLQMAGSISFKARKPLPT